MSKGLEGQIEGRSIYDRLLGRPITIGLGVLLVYQVIAWVPQYLTWPYWADHDVFATMAQGWDAGQLPYRDLLGNNFPGTIYIFWVLGHLFGWGKTMPFYAVDAALIVGLAALIVAWSLRRFGKALPGLLGAGALLGYFMALDFSTAAQRDGQGPILAVAGMLILQSWPGRLSRLASALFLAMAVSIRPQVILFVPAYWMSIDESARPAGTSFRRSIWPWIEWNLAVGALVAFSFVPLVMSGVFNDFLQGLKVVAYGGKYNQVGPRLFWSRILEEFEEPRLYVVAATVLLCFRMLRSEERRLVIIWLAALAGIIFYAPLSPILHPYTMHAIHVVWSIQVALSTRIILVGPGLGPYWRMIMLGILATQSLALWPTSFSPLRSIKAVKYLWSGESPAIQPRGYWHPWQNAFPLYPWADYRALINYLKTSTDPKTKVADVLMGVAVTAPAGRLSAFPTESATWIHVVTDKDLPRFVEALEKTPDSVVVWDQELPEKFLPDLLTSAIRRLYRPKVRFGAIEVWERKPSP